jgi:hypothetical protein
MRAGGLAEEDADSCQRGQKLTRKRKSAASTHEKHASQASHTSHASHTAVYMLLHAYREETVRLQLHMFLTRFLIGKVFSTEGGLRSQSVFSRITP